MGCLSGWETSVCRGPIDSSGLGLRQVGVMDVDAGNVAVGRDIVDSGVVNLK